MSTNKRRFLAILLSVAMLLQTVPASVLAEAEWGSILSAPVGGATYYSVSFKDKDGNDIAGTTRLVASGSTTEAPAAPAAAEGYAFAGWSDGSTTYGPAVNTFTITGETTFTATYRKLTKYLVQVKYLYEDGTVAMPPYQEYVTEGTAYYKTISSPTIAGFTPKLSNGDAAQSVTINQTITANTTVTVTYYGNNVGYTIYYRQQNLDDDTQYTVVSADTETGTAKMGSTVSAPEKTYAGFYRVASETPTLRLGSVAADNVLYVDYNRSTYLLTFDTQGGSYIAPRNLRYGTTITVEAPTQLGYTFAGWQDGDSSSWTSGSTMPAANLALTALWTPSTTASYTVVYWREKVPTGTDWTTDSTDYQNGYDFAESAVVTNATVGSTVTYTAKSYTGFKSTPKMAETSKTVAADGSTVCNVYYARQTYTIKFFTKSYNSWPENTSMRITAKYGTDVSAKWTANCNTSDKYSWATSSSGGYNRTYYTLIANMPANSFSVYGFSNSGSQYIIYYTETLTAGQYKVYSKYENQSYGYLTVEDQQPIEGFTFSSWSSGSTTSNFSGQGEDSDIYYRNSSWLKYTRNSYSISFSNCQSITPRSVKFEAVISSANPGTPLKPAGVDSDYTFGGWYTSPACETGTEANWNATMPAHNLIFYAKWVKPTYTVTFNARGGSAVAQQTVEKYGTIEDFLASSASKPTKANDTFAGWYEDEALTMPMVINRQITGNVTLYARWESDNIYDYSIEYVDANGAQITEDANHVAITNPVSLSGAQGATVSAEPIAIDGYYSLDGEKTMTLDRNLKVFTFHYIAVTTWNYSVQYLLKGTTTQVAPTVARTSSAQQVVEHYLPIANYELVSADTQTLAIDAQTKVVTFEYSPDTAPYKVKHVRHAADGTTTTETEIFTGSVGHVVTASGKTYANYTLYTSGDELTGVVTRDGGLVITLDYYPEEIGWTIHHVEKDNTSNRLAEDTTGVAAFGATVNTADKKQTIDGFTYDSNSGDITVGASAAANVATIYYTRNSYTLKITYVGPADGVFTAPEKHTATLKYGDSFSVPSPNVTGYTPDRTTVEGTMPANNVEVTVTYAANDDTAYKVEHYKAKLDGTYNEQPDDTDQKTGVTGQLTQAVSRTTVGGYVGFTAKTFEQVKIAGDGSTVVKIYYTRNSYTLTVNYTGPDDGVFTAPETQTKTVLYGADYSVASPAVAGYTPDRATVTGTMPAKDVTEEVEYSAGTGTAYTVGHYKANLDGSYNEKPDETENLEGTTGQLTAAAAKAYDGFTAEKFDQVKIVGDGSTVVKIYYTRNSYTLKITYVGPADGVFTAPEKHTATLKYGDSFSVPSPDVTGYTPDRTTVEGKMPANNVEVTVTYAANDGTAYKVEHYKAKLDGSYNEKPDDTDAMTGVTGQLTQAVARTTVGGYVGFTAKTFEQVKIAGDGSTVVKIYYTRNSYTLTVNYTGPDDEVFVAPKTQTKTVLYGADYSVASPAVAGYTPDRATVTGTMPAEDVTENVVYSAGTGTAYTVGHYKANLDGSYNEKPDETENLEGTTGQLTAAAAKAYDGFTAEKFDQVKIVGDGSTVVKIYYTRNSYDVSYQYTGATPDGATALPATVSYKLGASVTVADDATAPNYLFSGWSSSDVDGVVEKATFTMPAKNVTIIGSFKADFESIGNGRVTTLDAQLNAVTAVTGYTLPAGVAIEENLPISNYGVFSVTNGSLYFTQTAVYAHEDGNGKQTTEVGTYEIPVKDINNNTGLFNVTVNITDDVPTIGVTALTGTVDSGTTSAESAWSYSFGADVPDIKTVMVGSERLRLADGQSVDVPGTYGTLTVNADGAYTYRANPNEVGNDDFTFAITDADNDTATVTLSVTVRDSTVKPDAVTFTTQDKETAENGSDTAMVTIAAGVTILQTSVDAVNATINYGKFSLSNGQLVFTQSAAYTHANTEDSHTFDVVSFNVTDANGNATTLDATVTIDDDMPSLSISKDEVTLRPGDTAAGSFIYHEGADTMGAALTVSVNGGAPQTVALTNGSATVAAANGVLSINTANGSYSYLANADAQGKDTFAFTLTDGDSDTASAGLTAKIARIDVTKTASKTVDAALEDLITYTIVVTNTSSDAAENVTVNDLMFAKAQAGSVKGGANSGAVSDASGSLSGTVFTIGTMEGDSSYTIQYTYKVTETDLLIGSISNTASISGTINQVSVTGSASAKVTTAGVSGELRIVKVNTNAAEATGVSDAFRYGDTAKFTVTVTNTYNMTLQDVTVTDTLDGAKILSGASYTVNAAGAAEIGSMAPGASVTLNVSYALKTSDVKTQESTLTNTAQVSAKLPTSETESVTIEKTATAQIRVQGKQPVAMTAQDAEKIYDGTALTNDAFKVASALAQNGTDNSILTGGQQTVTLTNGDVVTALLGDDAQTASVTESTITNVGTVKNHLISYMIKNAAGVDMTANYAVELNDGTLTINKRPVTITADSAEKVYDGTALMDDGWKNTPPTNIADSEAVASVTVNGSQIVPGASNNVPSAAVIKRGETDVTENYAITYVNGTLTVKENATAITVTAKDAAKAYDGTALTETGYTVTLGEGLTGSMQANGSYKLSTGDTLTVTMGDDQMTADVTESTITNVGTNKNHIVSYAITSADGTDAKSYYTSVETADGQLTINAIKLTITAKKQSYVYNGSVQGPQGTAFTTAETIAENVTVSGLAGGDTLSGVTVAGGKTDAGTYTAELQPSAAEITTSNTAEKPTGWTGNYSVEYKNGDLEITKKGANNENEKLIITAIDQSYPYNGSVQGPRGTAFTTAETIAENVTVSGLVGGDTLSSVTVAGGKQYIGEYADELVPSAAAITSGHSTADAPAGWTGNYVIVYQRGKLTITGNGTPITVTADSAEKTYDGTVLTKGTFTLTSGTLVAGDYIEATVTGTITDYVAGGVKNVISDIHVYNGTGENKKDVSNNYGITGVDGTLTINKRPVTITVDAAQKKFGENDPTFTGTVEAQDDANERGLVTGEALHETYYRTNTLEYVDVYKDVLSAKYDANTNYDVEVVPGTFTITGNPVIPEKTTPQVESNYALGAKIPFTITVQNNTNHTLSNVAVNDPTAAITDGTGYTVTDEHNAVITSIEVGSSVAVSAEHTVTEADILAATYENTAYVSAENKTVDATDQSSDVEEPRGHLTVTKTTTSTAKNGLGTYALGETIAYKITVRNDGNLTITDITVTDALSTAEGKKIGEIASLAPNASEDFTFTYTVTEADILQGKVVNNATATGTSPDPKKPEVPVTPGTKEDPTVSVSGELILTKTNTNAAEATGVNGAFRYGDTIEYSVTVKNTGNVTLSNVLVVDRIPGVAMQQGNGYTVTGDSATITNLPIGSSVTLTAKYVVKASDVKDTASTFTNTATAKGVTPQNKETPLATASATVNIQAKQKLTITAKDATKEYDGAALTNPEFKVTSALAASGEASSALTDGVQVAALQNGDVVTALMGDDKTTVVPESSIAYVGETANHVISYSITIKDVNGTDMTPNYAVTLADGKLTVTQVYATIDISKTWKRPDSITDGYPDAVFVLYRDGEQIPLGGSAQENVSLTLKYPLTVGQFQSVPVGRPYQPNQPDGGNGRYLYYVAENKICGYEADKTQTGEFTLEKNVRYKVFFTNTMKTISVSGAKTWKLLNEETTIPTIKITLNRNGTPYRTTEITNGGNAYTFDELPKCDPSGKSYVYTVEEDNVPGFTGAQDGLNFTNTQKSLTYTVEYYLENLGLNGYDLDGAATVVKENQGYGWPVTYEQKAFDGFNYVKTTVLEKGIETEYTGAETVPDDGELVVRVYYSRRTDLTYTIEYRRGSETGPELLPAKEATGCTFGASYPEQAPELSNHICDSPSYDMVITTGENKHIFVYVHIVDFSVKYYYDGVLDPTATEMDRGRVDAVITHYTGKAKGGYKLEKTEGFPLKLTDDSKKNVIKVYYTKIAPAQIDIPVGNGGIAEPNVGDCVE